MGQLKLVFSTGATALNTRAEPEPSVVRAVELTHLTLCAVRFGTETRIVIDPVRADHVPVPITCQLLCHLGSHVMVGPGLASVATTDNPVFMPRSATSSERAGAPGSRTPCSRSPASTLSSTSS